MLIIIFIILIPLLLGVFCVVYAIKEYKLIKENATKSKARFIALCICASVMTVIVLYFVFSVFWKIYETNFGFY